MISCRVKPKAATLFSVSSLSLKNSDVKTWKTDPCMKSSVIPGALMQPAGFTLPVAPAVGSLEDWLLTQSVSSGKM